MTHETNSKKFHNFNLVAPQKQPFVKHSQLLRFTLDIVIGGFERFNGFSPLQIWLPDKDHIIDPKLSTPVSSIHIFRLFWTICNPHIPAVWFKGWRRCEIKLSVTKTKEIKLTVSFLSIWFAFVFSRIKMDFFTLATAHLWRSSILIK